MSWALFALAFAVFSCLAIAALALLLVIGSAARRLVKSGAAPPVADGLVDLGIDGLMARAKVWAPAETVGDGHKAPVYLLLHGIGASREIWRHVRGPLRATGAWVVEMDWPGFGDSPPPDFGRVSLDEWSAMLGRVYEQVRGLRSADSNLRVVASSMGASIALHLDQLLGTDAPPILAMTPALDPQRVPRWLLKVGSSRLARRLALFVSPLTLSWAERQVINGRSPEAQRLIRESTTLTWRAYSRSPEPTQTFLKALSILADPRLSPDRVSARPSTRVLVSRRDRLVARAPLLAWCQRWSLVAVEHLTAGHHIMEEDPSWTFEQIKTWSEGLTSSPARPPSSGNGILI